MTSLPLWSYRGEKKAVDAIHTKEIAIENSDKLILGDLNK
jgi:hypothetical protein